MKLLCSSTSPFSAKVRMAARFLDIKLTEVSVDTNAGPSILVAMAARPTHATARRI